jgi:hypothetical protein
VSRSDIIVNYPPTCKRINLFTDLANEMLSPFFISSINRLMVPAACPEEHLFFIYSFTLAIYDLLLTPAIS